jgi:hypothetical protein
MKTIFHFLAVSAFLLGSATAGELYTGKFIDAHNQFGCDSKLEDIKRLIDNSSVDYTLLSARLPCDQQQPFDAHLRVLKIIDQSPDRVGFLISTKIGGGAGTTNRAYQTLLRAEKELLSRAHGYAEILVQHHEVNDRSSQFRGLKMSLTSPEIERTIEVVKRSKKPLIIHIEPRDHPDEATLIFKELEELLIRASSYPIFLIHLGQLTHEKASALLRSHQNLNLILSTVDPLSQRGIKRRERLGEVAQSGWVNIFEDDGSNYSRKHFDAYASSLKVNAQWQSLFEEFPDRFVIGIESVYAEPWLNSYHLKVRLWKYVFTTLKPDVAKKIACENAAKHWSIPISC